MNLFDILSSAQGGNAIKNIGAIVGLDPAMAEKAIKELLPSVSTGLKEKTNDEDGLRSLIESMNNSQDRRYADEPDILPQDQTRNRGNDILGEIFGKKEVSRRVAKRASENTGISDSILKKMLPLIVSVVMGVLAKRVFGTGMRRGAGKILTGGLLGGLLNNRLVRTVGLGFIGKMLFRAIKAGGWAFFRNKMRGRGLASSRSGSDFFGSLLDADNDGSVVDDLFRMATGGR